jgi:hypothetical protein
MIADALIVLNIHAVFRKRFSIPQSANRWART